MHMGIGKIATRFTDEVMYNKLYRKLEALSCY